MSFSVRVVIAIVTAIIAASPIAGALTVSTEAKAAPDTVSEAIRDTLQDSAVVLSDGDTPAWEFWFCKQVALPYAPEEGQTGLDVIKNAALVGVLSLNTDARDFKDNLIEKGVYTLRYLEQPIDGNHMGTATYNHFLVMLPVSFDKDVETDMDHDEVADESMDSSVDDHPMNLNLQPVNDVTASLPALGDGADDSKILEVSIPVAADGKALDTPMMVGIVYEGHGHI